MTMDFSVRGKIAIVTGASSGLGDNFARRLAAEGAVVAACARRTDRLDKLVADIGAAGGKAQAFAMDVSDPGNVESGYAAIVKALGAPDIVVNNAGIAQTKASLELTDADWRQVMDTNLDGAWRVAQAAAKAMVAAKKPGSIVNIASILGLRVASHLLAYNAAKAALIHVTHSLALEWARYGIRVHAIAPGYFETEITAGFFATEPGQAMLKRVPQRRIGKLGELDGALLLLASQAGAYMTGAVVVVDGGHTMSSL